jgi:flagellar export protein FliJ
MKRSQRLRTLVRLAEHSERAAAREFALGKRELDAAQARLAQLRAARAEYVAAAGIEGDPLRLGELRRFLAQLDGLILQLEWQAQRKRLVQERQREVWAGKHARAQALDDVTTRARRAEASADTNRAEREIEDQAVRRALAH